MPCVRIERWICDRCGAIAETTEADPPHSHVYPTPEGWTFADLSPALEGPLCQECIIALRNWIDAGKRDPGARGRKT